MKTLRIIIVSIVILLAGMFIGDFIAVLFQGALAAQVPDTAQEKSVDCIDRVKLQESMIDSLAAQNETLLLRVQALSQLLTVRGREESDEAARSKVDDVEQEILRGMNLADGCKVQKDWSVVCETPPTSER